MLRTVLRVVADSPGHSRGCSYKQIVQHGVTRGYWFKPGTPDSDSKISQRLSVSEATNTTRELG